ncbi:MAG: ATP-binding protein [Actinomycetota bacterium]|nr:ATP-binding protein [Actinomycetota bacterium]
MDAPEVGRVDRAVEHIYQKKILDNIACLSVPEPARMAVYEGLSTCPEIEEVGGESAAELVGLLATRTYQVSQESGGRIPFAAIKEVVENLVHAQFKEVVVSVFKGGNSIKISDRGPGIKDKTKALEPGYSSATTDIKGLIKGVGSGLSVALGAMTEAGGSLKLDDNLDGGAVVTLTVSGASPEPKPTPVSDEPAPPRLSKRQKKVIFIILEIGQVGPARLATELSVGLSTAYRDLQALEGLGLIKCDKHGKRCLTDVGVDSLDAIMNSA